MQINILDYLEASARRNPEKIAIIEEEKSVSYADFQRDARRIGSGLIAMGVRRAPVIVFMDKGIDALCAFMGVAYAGCCYSLLNPEFPRARLEQIASVLQSKIVIADPALADTAKEIFADAAVTTVDALRAHDADESALAAARRRAIDTDPLYINFTSGSTGTPKGIAVGHRSVIDFIDCFTEIMGIAPEDVIANQAPFDFDVSVKDIYSALRVGATLVIVPKRFFSAPVQLIDYLCANRITVMIWAVSALCLISTFHGLDYRTPETVRRIIFSGEVMPHKHLMTWMRHLPNAMFVNVYGPTEITCNCTYHILEAGRDYSGGIPIGKPFPNEDVFLLDADDRAVTEADAVGEICVRGSALALGYYRAEAQTARSFVRSPLNPCYPEIIYRTGDLGKYDTSGDLFFCGRKDFQIKHMGHRIELEEIERAMAAIDGVERCCCTFDERKSRLKGFYIGAIEKDALYAAMKERMPEFMIPGVLRRVDEMPLTKNGKIDRRKLEEIAGGKKNG